MNDSPVSAPADTVRVALTGGIGSGKSTVARRFAELGAVVIDADAIARQIVEPGQPALAAIVDQFGDGVLAADGSLDRAALAAIVFTDDAARQELNAITHPRIAERSAALIAAAPPGSVVVFDMPLLVEQGTVTGWDAVVVVETPMPLRRHRLQRDRGMTFADIDARVAAQADDEQRRAVADVVLVNDGSLDQLRDAADQVWRTIQGSAARPPN